MGIFSALFGDVEKWINEHGSAALLEQRLKLADDKYDALERGKAQSDERAAILESETSKLREQVRALSVRVAELERTAPRDGRLEEVRERILVLLARLPTGNRVMAAEVARSAGIGEQVARFHLDEMKEASMVNAAYFTTGRIDWSLGPEGRRYLIENGLLK
jgi:hypothetical protein